MVVCPLEAHSSSSASSSSSAISMSSLHRRHGPTIAPPRESPVGVHRGEDEIIAREEERNRKEAIVALMDTGRSIDSVPLDLAAAIDGGRIPGEVVRRFVDLDSSLAYRWLMRFRWFKERLLVDDLFLVKVAIEGGVGIFTKLAAEYIGRQGRFFEEIYSVFAAVVMALIADFMLVWFLAPTISLRPPLSPNAGPISKFFHGCPNNAFQLALPGTSYSILQRVNAMVRNGFRLFVVGACASLVGSGLANALVNMRHPSINDSGAKAEDLVLSASIAYGVHLSLSSNLRYQVVAGVTEQRVLAPLLYDNKLILSLLCFVVRTANSFVGALIWIDFARWSEIQKI